MKTRNFLLAALLGLTAGCVPYTTGSTEVGVRTNKIGGLFNKGVQDDIYRPGSTNFFPAVITDWNTFDTALQNLEMTRESNTGDRQGDDSLRFKTIDGNDISVNVTVSWRVDANKAPYLLKFVGDSTDVVEDVMVRAVSRTTIRDVLNLLKSEEYYNTELRFKKAEESRTLLNQVLNPEGIIIEQVLLGEHQFNSGYQQANRLISETQAAREQVLRDLEKAKGEVSRTIEEAKGNAQKRKLEADAIFFENERQAQAILAEKRALAEGLTERARALGGAGGENMVKLKVAESLKGKEIIFLPAGGGMDVRTTDVNALLERYGVGVITGADK
jgi:regulator of protease activity HflC (stomatin/prohibitin superfamily)